MPILLHIDSSPMGEASISRLLTREFVRRWRSAHPAAEIISRDLTTAHIPVVTAEWVAANYTPAESRTTQQNEILKPSTQFTREVLRADEYVIGVPMHNWGPASSLKLWTDQIVRFGETVLITPSGMRGTLGAKKITFLIAAGRHYKPGPADAPRSLLIPWLQMFFGHLGVQEMQFHVAEGAADIRLGKVDRADFLAPHLAAVESLFEQPSLR